MTDDDFELIYSPLNQTYSAEGHTLHIYIYRGAGEPWMLEVVDELGTSTVWDECFDTDAAALAAAFEAFEEEGVHNFVVSAQQEAEAAELELLGGPAEADDQAEMPAPQPTGVEIMMTPLSEEELDDLEAFLLDLDADESMTLDMLDGFLHALAIGPELVMPTRWLPKVWGQEDGALLPPVDILEEANLRIGQVMRHFNGIVSCLELNPPVVVPRWNIVQYEGTRLFDQAEMWAYGFDIGVQLSRPAWQPLLDTPDGARWYRPIGLLGADDFSADQDELTRTPEQREALAEQIEESLLQMHAHWLPLRQAVAERERARLMARKVGRNEPCPCGSGKKFKKCCGAPAEVH